MTYVCVCSPPTLDRDAGGEEKSLGRKNEEDLPPLKNTREGNRQTWVRLSLQIILCFCFNVGVQYAAAETSRIIGKLSDPGLERDKQTLSITE